MTDQNQTPEERPSPRPRSHPPAKRRTSIATYLLILFAVAFLLLLVAYFQQQRANSETTDALRQSASAVDTIQAMMEDNDELRSKVEELEGQVEQLEEQVDNLTCANTELDAARRVQNNNLNALTDQVEAMQWFWQIDDYYVRGYNRKARELIEQFEALGLKESLPTENTTGTDRLSPAERYEEIYDTLY